MDNASVFGGVDFFRNDGTHEHFVAVNGAANAEIYKYTGGSWESQAQSLTKDNRVRFAYSPTIDTLFATNKVDALRSFDGSAWSAITNVTDAPKAAFLFSFGDRIYALNCSVDGTLYPSRAYRTEPIETEATWSAENYIVFNDVITGVGINGGNMFIGGQYSTYIFTLSEGKFQVSTVGCTSHEGIASHSKYTFYPAIDGYYCYDGTDTFKISSPVQEYWDKIPEASLPEIQAAAEGDHVYVYIGDIVSPWDSTETLRNVVLDYNVLQNNWSRGRLGEGCSHLHTFVTAAGRKIFMGSSDGNVFEMFDDSGQQHGVDYASSFETSWTYGSGASKLDDFEELWGFGFYLSGIKVSYKCEGRDNWTPIGELNEDTDVVKFKKRAYKIKFRLAEISGKNLYEISRLDVGFIPAYERHNSGKGR